MIRAIAGFHADDAGDWVAELSCLHNQHVRHDPPFSERPWVLTEAGRSGRLGADLDCPLCDRAELPAGVELARTAGPFNQATLPAALQRDHRVADRTWAVPRVLHGEVDIEMATTPPVRRRLGAGEDQAIPPSVNHQVHLVVPARVEIDFLVRR